MLAYGSSVPWLVVFKSFSPIVVCSIVLMEVLKAQICFGGDTTHYKIISNHLLWAELVSFLEGHFCLGEVKGVKCCNQLGCLETLGN